MAMNESRPPPGVLVVCAVNGHGGPVQSMLTVLREIDADDWRVTVATQLGEHGQPTPLEAVASSAFRMTRPRGPRLLIAQYQLLRGGWRLRKSLRSIHANGLTEAVVALPLAMLARVRMVVWIHNSEYPRPFRALIPIIRRVSTGWTWIAVSSLAADLVFWTVPAIVPNPVSSDFVPHEKQRGDQLVVTYLAGSDRPNKGFDLLPSIIRTCPSTAVRWILYTSPPYSSPDSRCIEAWTDLLGGLSDRVEIRARTGDVASALWQADIVIAPSRRESFNRVIAESIATGTPFVASDIPAHRELSGLSGGGLLFSLDDPKQAGDLIDMLNGDRDRWAELCARNRSHRSVFSPTTVSDMLKRAWASELPAPPPSAAPNAKRANRQAPHGSSAQI